MVKYFVLETEVYVLFHWCPLVVHMYYFLSLFAVARNKNSVHEFQHEEKSWMRFIEI